VLQCWSAAGCATVCVLCSLVLLASAHFIVVMHALTHFIGFCCALMMPTDPIDFFYRHPTCVTLLWVCVLR
jgi:hypothetical protein